MNQLVIPVENAIITINGEKTDYRTDKNGKVAIVLDKEGTYVLSAVSGTDTQILVPAVCELTVAKAENSTESPEPSENTASTNKDENSPQTGDNSQAYLYLAMAIAVMAGVVIFRIRERMIMRNKFWGRIVSLLTILILIIGSVPVQGGNETDTVGEAYELMDGIVRYKISQSGVGNIQQWIDGALTKNAGATSEWYVLALGQSGEYNFTSYVKALKEYLNSHTVSSATSRQKYAIALAATGSTDSYISSVMEETIGEQGIMSWVYGLHLLNNGYVSSKETVATVKDKILSLQLADGGWAIMGTNGDSDVTSMVIQALAPYYNKDTEITAAVDKALTLLSSCQLEDGDYAGYGVANLESTAQVITALSSLGIDGEKDSRFIKNGNTLFDGLRKYQLTDGSFCHELDGGYNDNATVQAFYAMVSYTRMMEGKSGLYILDNCNPSGFDFTFCQKAQ